MTFVRKIAIILFVFLLADGLLAQTSGDTSYIGIAPLKIQNMLKSGKAPKVTLQLSFDYNVGLMDLASNDNTSFWLQDFIGGRDFGTRYGFGVSLTGKIALHKEGNVRLNVTASFNRFMSNFVISESPDGKVAYNMLGGGLGLENCFTPNRPFKPYIGFDVVVNAISGKATFRTDSTDFNLTIKNSVRIGFDANVGFEYAFSNQAGINLGIRFTHANVIGRQNKTSANLNETYLNDDKQTGTTTLPFTGWKQFFYGTFYGGFNFYFGMKNRK